MVKEYAKKLDKDVEYVDESVLETLIKYKWPGNIRELQNIIEYSVNMSSSNRITVDIITKQNKAKAKKSSIDGD